MSPRKTSGWGKPAKRTFEFKDRSGRVHGKNSEEPGPSHLESDSKKENEKLKERFVVSPVSKPVQGKRGGPKPSAGRGGKQIGRAHV